MHTMLRQLIPFMMLRGSDGHSADGWDLPSTCVGQMWAKDSRWTFVGNYSEDSGHLVPMSWHIHYTTNSSDMPRFYRAMIERYQSHFPPTGHQCPFGPNWGSYTYKYMCSLEGALNEEFILQAPQHANLGGDPWGPLEQRAFFIPVEHVEEVWNWVSQPEVRGYLDVLLHANTGCMHDDHGIRIQWKTPNARSAPHIRTLEFPCNVPSSGCNDSKFEGPPSCGCNTPLKSDEEKDSCKHCQLGQLPPKQALSQFLI